MISVRMQSFFSVVAVAVASCIPATPQSTPASPSTSTSSTVETPTFRANTRMVIIPVVVTSHGKHLTQLKREDFQIVEQGAPRQIAQFEEVQAGLKKEDVASAVKLAGMSNFVFGEERPEWRLTVIMLDGMDTPYLVINQSRKQIAEYLAKSLRRDEPTALFTLFPDGLKELHGFTENNQVLLDALSGSKQSMDPRTEELSKSIDDFVHEHSNDKLRYYGILGAPDGPQHVVIDAMNQLARVLKPIPGRKALIWAAGTIPYMYGNPYLISEYNDAIRALVEAHVSIYTIDARGLGHSGQQDMLWALAEATGGIACMNRNNMSGCVEEAVQDSSQYYVLGYYLPPDDLKPGWRKLKVSVSIPGASVRARNGFYVTDRKPAVPKSQAQEVVDALKTAADIGAIRLNVNEVKVAGDKPADKGKSWHEFLVGVFAPTIDTANGNALDLTVTTVAFDQNMKNAGETQQHLTAKLPTESALKLKNDAVGVRQALQLPPGRYEIRFAVRDNLNGEVGSVRYPLVVN